MFKRVGEGDSIVIIPKHQRLIEELVRNYGFKNINIIKVEPTDDHGILSKVYTTKGSIHFDHSWVYERQLYLLNRDANWYNTHSPLKKRESNTMNIDRISNFE